MPVGFLYSVFIFFPLGTIFFKTSFFPFFDDVTFESILRSLRSAHVGENVSILRSGRHFLSTLITIAMGFAGCLCVLRNMIFFWQKR